MIRNSLALIVAAIFAACSTTSMTQNAPATAVAELAPTGKLRAVINVGNPVLASKDPATGEARGVSVDLARELAKRLGVPLEPIVVPAAARSVDAIKSGACDLAFVAIDPVRAVDMDYSAPYVLIEGVYLVPQGSPIVSNADVDRKGVRVVVSARSAYDLYLTRELKQAEIVRAPTAQAPVDTMVAQGFEVAAGIRQQLEADARRVPGLRLLPGRFMVINQAMATPKNRPAGTRYVAEFAEEMKASGFVASALARHGIDGAAVAPPAGK